MKKLLLLAALCMLVALALASVASASSTEDAPPPPPKYEVTKDGLIRISGDVLAECRGIVQGYQISPTEDPATRAEAERKLQEYVAACRAAGFPPAGGTATAQTDRRLPDTGGPAVTLFAAAMLAGLGLGGLLLARLRRP